MKKILVTTDFSELADQAIGPAADLARRLGAELALAHAVPAERPPTPQQHAPYYEVALRIHQADQELEAQARKSLEERGRALGGLPCTALLARGAPVAALVELARAECADLIVIASQGRTGFKRLFLGSVAEELARTSPIPVLIWKQPEADPAP